jgi:hypothetical protein
MQSSMDGSVKAVNEEHAMGTLLHAVRSLEPGGRQPRLTTADGFEVAFALSARELASMAVAFKPFCSSEEWEDSFLGRRVASTAKGNLQ